MAAEAAAAAMGKGRMVAMSPLVPGPQQSRSLELLERQLSLLLSHLCTSRPSEELDKLGELRSMTEHKTFLSPITPAYDKLARLHSGAWLGIRSSTTRRRRAEDVGRGGEGEQPHRRGGATMQLKLLEVFEFC
ncbi:hypothetical protein Cni_G26996 [Canna indica]|uniref:Uncharacterized protein n=1 Tax=Canna indica TaxID=4628 RepID=A0AAQ3L453_9LILI|nr:hypothetical protein Cni_G26996 [Canna indica]